MLHGFSNLIAGCKGGDHIVEHVSGGMWGIGQQNEVGIRFFPYGLQGIVVLSYDYKGRSFL
jgi:hypothetical protein